MNTFRFTYYAVKDMFAQLTVSFHKPKNIILSLLVKYHASYYLAH